MRIVGTMLLTAAITAIAPGHIELAAQGGSGAEEIKKVAEAYRKASLAGDVKAIVAVYTENAVEMPPHQAAIKGRAAIEAYYQNQMAEGKLTALNLTHIDTQASGDIGYDVGSYTQTLQSGGGASMKQSGYYTITLKKVGGAWKVSSAMYHPDSPPPAEPMKGTQQ